MAVSSVGMLGDGITHGRSVASAYMSPLPSLHLHDLERRTQPEMLVEQPRELADGHPVAHRYRELADERFEPLDEQRPFDVVAADRVWPIAHDDRNAMPRAGAQAVGHRVDVGVDASADVLQIDDEHIEAGEHRGRRFARLTVEGIHRHATSRVVGVRRLDHVVLHVGSEPVLRAEDRRQRDVRRRGKSIDDVQEATIERGVIADDANARAL